MAKRSAVAGLLSDLTEGLSKATAEEREQVLNAGRKLVASRRALPSKRRRPAAGRSRTRDRIRAAS